MIRREYLRSGWTRLAVVLLVPWTVYWGWEYSWLTSLEASFEARRMAVEAEIQGDFATTGYTTGARFNSESYATEGRDAAAEQKDRAVKIGAGVPVAMAVLLIAGWWVAGGFRRR